MVKIEQTKRQSETRKHQRGLQSAIIYQRSSEVDMKRPVVAIQKRPPKLWNPTKALDEDTCSKTAIAKNIIVQKNSAIILAKIFKEEIKGAW